MDRIGKDIIVRLRTEVDPTIYEYDFARRGEREEAAAEIERLRAALKAALERIPTEHDFDHVPADDEVRAQCVAALSDEQTPSPEGECPECGTPWAMGVHSDNCSRSQS